MSSGGLKAVIAELAEAFARASGHRLATVFNPPNAVKTRIEGGEACRRRGALRRLIDELAAKGKVAAASRVAAGALRARRRGARGRAQARHQHGRRIPAARCSMRSRSSAPIRRRRASGIHFQKVIQRARHRRGGDGQGAAQSGSYNAEIVARGEAELAIQQISEILPVKGADWSARCRRACR